MPEFNVTWEMPIEAATHEEACMKAHNLLRDPDNTATVFIAEMHGVKVVVDCEDGSVVINDGRTDDNMMTVYCIAIDSEDAGGSQWVGDKSAWEAMYLEHSTHLEDVTPFEMRVPKTLTPREITAMVDNAMWDKQYVAATETWIKS